MIKEQKEPKVIEPSAARLMESLRDTGYTFPTAVADIVDNCVAAGATDIRISLELEFGGSPVLMIADNGKGMNQDEIEKAMMYGSPLRPSPKSLGKFGMGLKTASTSFCRKLTVISVQDKNYSLRQWDLDVVTKKDKWILIEPDISDFEEQMSFLNEVAVGGHGTLVIWENVDRLIRSNFEGTTKIQIEKIVEDLNEHLAGVFYNFLHVGGDYPDITIQVNEIMLEAWDPFCRWLNDEKGIRVEVNPNKLQYESNRNGVKEIVGTFNVNVYIVPNSTELTNAELTKMRYGLDNQGFHIFREGRMIYSGGWPNRLFVKDPHLNLVRVELLFDHLLDDYFQIDIKKSRIDFPKDLRDTLKKVLAPAKNEANKRYRSGNSKSGKSSLMEQHNKSGNAIGKHHEETTAGSQVGSVNLQNGETQVKNRYGTTYVKLVLDDKHDCVVQTRANLEDGVLWAPGLVENNNHAVFLNESHDFYKKFYLANKENSALILAMDSILWSLAEAELSVLSDSVKRNLEDLRISVSRSLRTLSVELPDIKESENKDSEGDYK